ncbi:putative Initiator tRNA phosphoribosyl transferase family protein [Paratrimastix pyriformis]|uniref:Initiator tRNA phosphoribosyl transferase family protein n=1 Tax=Paratrimastix pyriformis TaxID=342808 RepID=A0ABQ8UB75_9EUKA|nr:putative Initiator tRNA phosphoribosyl transferase family protein [Paratrimastix pyriformis]
MSKADLLQRTRLYDSLMSIREDLLFLQEIMRLFAVPHDDLFANLRCGLWYVPNCTNTAYFKSTDGHANNWGFSLIRTNFQFALAAAPSLLASPSNHTHLPLLVDSTKRGKRFPDSLSKTVPIWATVLNRAVYQVRARGLLSPTSPTTPRSEPTTPLGIPSSTVTTTSASPLRKYPPRVRQSQKKGKQSPQKPKQHRTASSGPAAVPVTPSQLFLQEHRAAEKLAALGTDTLTTAPHGLKAAARERWAAARKKKSGDRKKNREGGDAHNDLEISSSSSCRQDPGVDAADPPLAVAIPPGDDALLDDAAGDDHLGDACDDGADANGGGDDCDDCDGDDDADDAVVFSAFGAQPARHEGVCRHTTDEAVDAPGGEWDDGWAAVQREIQDNGLPRPDQAAWQACVLPPWVPGWERAAIEERIDKWVAALLGSGIDLTPLAAVLQHPLRCVWLSQSTGAWDRAEHIHRRLAMADGPDTSPLLGPRRETASTSLRKKSRMSPIDPALFYLSVFFYFRKSVSDPATDCPALVHALLSATASAAAAAESTPGDSHRPWDWIGDTGMALGGYSAGRPPDVWEHFGAVLNCGSDEWPEMGAEHGSGSGSGNPDDGSPERAARYLCLHLLDGKKQREGLLRALPVALHFVEAHLRAGRKVLLHCSQGHLLPPGQQPSGTLDKRDVKRVLAFICACRPAANPSAFHVHQLHRFFFSPAADQSEKRIIPAPGGS